MFNYLCGILPLQLFNSSLQIHFIPFPFLLEPPSVWSSFFPTQNVNNSFQMLFFGLAEGLIGDTCPSDFNS